MTIVAVGTAVLVAVAVSVSVGDAVGVAVAVDVGVLVAVAVGVAVLVGVDVLVGARGGKCCPNSPAHFDFRALPVDLFGYQLALFLPRRSVYGPRRPCTRLGPQQRGDQESESDKQ